MKSDYKTYRGITIGSTVYDVLNKYGFAKESTENDKTFLRYILENMSITFYIDDNQKVETVVLNDSDKIKANKLINVTGYPNANNLTRNDFLNAIENYPLKCFLDNKSLSLIENEMIKKNVINVLLYTYNYISDINTIEMDEDASKEWCKEWLSNAYYYEEGWSISQELHHFASGNADYIIDAIDADFMIRPGSYLENDILDISVVFYENDIYGNRPLRLNYDLVFKKIAGTYKLIGITAQA